MNYLCPIWYGTTTSTSTKSFSKSLIYNPTRILVLVVILVLLNTHGSSKCGFERILTTMDKRFGKERHRVSFSFVQDILVSFLKVEDFPPPSLNI